MLHIAHITQYWQASSTIHPLSPKGANQHHQLYTTTDLPSAAHPPNQLPDGKSSPGHIEEIFQYQVAPWGLRVEKKLQVELSKKKNILIVIR